LILSSGTFLVFDEFLSQQKIMNSASLTKPAQYFTQMNL